jgi:hypothetical protein
MIHPLAFISNSVRKPIFYMLLAWTLIVMAVSQAINAPLKSLAAPASIVSFELARTPSNAQSMIASWNSKTQLFAAFGLGFDFLFMPSYALTIALATLVAAGRHTGLFTRMGAWLGWGVFLALIFDAIENIGLWYSLLGNSASVWPAISFLCAVLKFTLILIGIAYALIGWILPRNNN